MDNFYQEIVIISVASAFFLLMGLSIVFLFQAYTQRQLKMLLEKKEMESLYKEELLKTRLETQEEVMNQLSIDLHDNIGQLLSSAKFLVAAGQRKTIEPSEHFAQADKTLLQAIQELRLISKSLNKEWLAQFNIIENLTNEVNRINNTEETSISFTHPSSLPLTTEKQLVLFRIIQETFQNCMKHGKASVIEITLEAADNEIHVTVKDNGIGFDPTDTSKQGVGIINIKQRVAMLNGTVHWQSGVQGTTVFIKLPASVVSI